MIMDLFFVVCIQLELKVCGMVTPNLLVTPIVGISIIRKIDNMDMLTCYM